MADAVRGDPPGESSAVNVLVGEGLAVVQAVAQANLRQPRYTDRVRTNVRGYCGCRVSAEKTKTNVVGEETVDRTHPIRRGPGDGMYEQSRRLNWGPTRPRRTLRTKKISRKRSASGSDEAIVSIDPVGQHNRLASQGPLDGIVRNTLEQWVATLARVASRRPPMLPNSRDV
jgi:hypothetical protein